MVFVADDLGAWLVGLLADAGRKKLTTLVLGSGQERALRQAAAAAVQATAEEMSPSGSEQAGQLAMVISEVFHEPMPEAGLAGLVTLLDGLQAGIARQLAVLDDARLTGVGQSSADVLGVPGTGMAERLTGHLVREIILRGSRGGPLKPLADQLNHDLTHLQGQRVEGMLARLANEVRDALARPLGEVTDPFAHLAPRPPFPSRLPAIWRVRSSRNPNFTGRAGDLAILWVGLSAASTMTVQAVHGMGGVGKTELVLEYAHRHAAEYDIVWWFEAEQSAAIPDRVSELATELGIPDVTDPEVTRRAVLMELRRRNRWLLIFDNAENVDQVRSLLPGGSGHVLVTTRRAGFRAIGGVLDLDPLERADAKALLRHRCPSLTDTDADRLAERLGDLPLALDQAAAYLDHTGLPAREYLDLLGADPDKLLARPGGSDQTVKTVWSLSIEHLVQAVPATVALLEICAWLAPEPIPLDLFTAHPEHLAGPLATAAQDQLAFTDTVAALMDYSLARRTMDALVVHRLVQEVTRSWHAGDTDRSLEPLRVALALLRAALPDDPWWDTASWPIFRKLMPHILAVAASADHHAIDMEALAWMLSTSGTYQRRMGRFDEALTMHKGALAIHSADASPASPAVVADDLDDVRAGHPRPGSVP